MAEVPVGFEGLSPQADDRSSQISARSAHALRRSAQNHVSSAPHLKSGLSGELP
jgi:hypothetical protein